MKATKFWLLLFLLLALPCRAETDFPAWLRELRAEAVAQGIGASALAALDGVTPDDVVMRLDRSQPEHKISFAQYRGNILSVERIRRGRALYAAHRHILRKMEKRYGVPAKMIVALWGIESSYGALKGNFSALRSLATLAYEGRRAALFRRELLAGLRILDEGGVKPDELRGSWAGAMGQCQFMPSTYLNHAADGDGDGRKDIWNNEIDTFASIANYLKYEGWDAARGWGMAATATRRLGVEYVGVKQAPRTLKEWIALGVIPSGGGKLAAHAARLYYLVQPDGSGGDSYLVTENYQALMRWNRSTYFATAAGLLADRITAP